jgi:hypothetical protein
MLPNMNIENGAQDGHQNGFFVKKLCIYFYFERLRRTGSIFATYGTALSRLNFFVRNA